jgi:mRNA-degrading endonuclease toxin of MazEF toxin-antitoxin module
MNLPSGKRRPRGRRNSPRRRPLYRFASLDKSRPVVVLTRDSAISYLSTVSVAPITSAIRGVPFEVALGTTME